MKLRVFTPVETFLETEISKIDFEALDGFFTLLPKHVDFASAMPPNILHFTTSNGQTKYMACNRGIVVKKGDEVSLSVHKAVLSDSLQTLSRTIEIEFKQDDEERKEVNTVMARLEAGLSRGFMKLKGDGADGSL